MHPSLTFQEIVSNTCYFRTSYRNLKKHLSVMSVWFIIYYQQMMKNPKTTSTSGPVISLEVTEKPDSIAIVWMSISTEQDSIVGYKVYLNGRMCGSEVPEHSLVIEKYANEIILISFLDLTWPVFVVCRWPQMLRVTAVRWWLRSVSWTSLMWCKWALYHQVRILCILTASFSFVYEAPDRNLIVYL